MTDSASHAGQDLPELPPADVSPYDSEDENGPIEYAWYEKAMREYATAAVLAERERCAKVCEARAHAMDGDPPDGQEREWGWMRDEARHCAAAIRADTKREPESDPK